MAWPVLCLILTMFLVGLAGCVFCMAKQIRELQQWRHDVTEICRQHLEAREDA